MLFRSLLAGLALGAVATASEAGPFRRHARQAYRPTYPLVYQQPTFLPTAGMPAGGVVVGPAPVVVASAEHVSASAAVVSPAAATAASPAPASVADGDGLDEVNAQRAARGLRPYIRDDGLTQAARACAQFRAAHGLFGHTANDFAFLPAGAFASAAGCAAYPASYGWMSCCVYEGHTYAGAAYVTGRDGKRYMHLFVR
jgi:hypothetical protein